MRQVRNRRFLPLRFLGAASGPVCSDDYASCSVICSANEPRNGVVRAQFHGVVTRCQGSCFCACSCSLMTCLGSGCCSLLLAERNERRCCSRRQTTRCGTQLRITGHRMGIVLLLSQTISDVAPQKAPVALNFTPQARPLQNHISLHSTKRRTQNRRTHRLAHLPITCSAQTGTAQLAARSAWDAGYGRLAIARTAQSMTCRCC